MKWSYVALCALLLVAAAAVAPHLCANGGDLPEGRATSAASIVPPDYDTFAPPREVGGQFTCPVFGTPVTRLTVHDPDRRTMAEVTNSEISYFNADGSLFFAGDEWGKGCIYDGRTGAVIRQLEGVENRPWHIRWSADPRKFYQYVGNQVRLVSADDLSYEVLHTFEEYSEIGPAGGEGDVSDDFRYFCFDGGGKLFVYDLIDDIKGPESPFPFANRNIDYATMSCSGDYVLVLFRATGSDRYQGTELYDRDWNFQRQLAPYCPHTEIAYDQDGAEIMVCAAYFKHEEFLAGSGAKAGDIIAIRLADGRITRLLDVPKWSHQMYSSCNTLTTPGYVYMSLTSRGLDPEEIWFPYHEEIIEVPTDGSERIRRLLHHRSRLLPGRSQKACQPDFCINRQGDRIIFKSNVGQEYTDLYMFSVPPREEPAPVATPAPGA